MSLDMCGCHVSLERKVGAGPVTMVILTVTVSLPPNDK